MPSVVVLEDDLLFLSRIKEAAKATGAEIRVVLSAEALLEACRSAAPALVLADLDNPRLAAALAVRALKDDPALAPIPVVGFFSHVHAERARDAREAGCDRVIARSAFVQELPRLLGAQTSG
jgi:CheY-like chemotaxis protein